MLKPTFDWLFRGPRGRVVIFQSPNLSIIVWLAAMLVSWLLTGVPARITGLVGTAAIIYWAIDEIFSGLSRFRKLLGLTVLTFTLVHLFWK